jgi:radical SAM protein with 4Fe4S-binding SPASM domain
MRQGPDYIQFYPTIRCNRSCTFCFNRTMPSVQDMSPALFRVMIAMLKQASVKTIDIIGGEPTMHPDIIGFIREAVLSDFFVNVSSNGSDLGILDKLMVIGQEVTVGISINDRRTLEEAGEFIRTRRPVVKTVFTAGLEADIIQTILSLKPKRFYLIYRDAAELAELKETIPFYQYVHAVQEHYDRSQVDTVYCSGFLPDIGNYPELERTRCPAGTTKLGIMPDGAVYPCNLFFGRKEFFLGNILTDSFVSIWNHAALAYFRTIQKNPCKNHFCRLHTQCHGGCPAQSLLLSGDLEASDPRCANL